LPNHASVDGSVHDVNPNSQDDDEEWVNTYEFHVVVDGTSRSFQVDDIISA